MNKAWIFQLKKHELQQLFRRYCKHRHTYAEHIGCYEPEYRERIGVLDVETSELTGDFGHILTYCIKVVDSPKIYKHTVTQKDILTGHPDRTLLKQFLKDIQNFDRLLVYWGSNRRFDIPFLRTRALKYNYKFPGYAEINVTDVYDIVRMKLRLRNNKLYTVAQHLKIPAKEHPINPEMWTKAKAGDKRALNYILTHNKEDVITTELVWKRLKTFRQITNSSI